MTTLHEALELAESRRQRIAALEAALRLCDRNCDHLHHAKADRHGIGEPCPVEERIKLALAEDKSDE